MDNINFEICEKGWYSIFFNEAGSSTFTSANSSNAFSLYRSYFVYVLCPRFYYFLYGYISEGNWFLGASIGPLVDWLKIKRKEDDEDECLPNNNIRPSDDFFPGRQEVQELDQLVATTVGMTHTLLLLGRLLYTSYNFHPI